MKHPIERDHCDDCGKYLNIKKLYNLSWRYTDKERTYLHSKSKIVHTGRFHLCNKCLIKRTT